jgi:hypothetical protein
MKSQKAKSLAWTMALVIFVVVVIYDQADWMGLMIPSAILIWYGLVAPTLFGKTGPREHNWSSLN